MQSFEVQKTNMLLLKNGGKIQNSAEAHVSYAYFDGTFFSKRDRNTWYKTSGHEPSLHNLEKMETLARTHVHCAIVLVKSFGKKRWLENIRDAFESNQL